MTLPTYRQRIAEMVGSHVLGLFCSGWTLMLALGILGLHVGYWQSFAAAALLNSTIGFPAEEVKIQALKRKYGRDR